jgi:hypothetical protein
MPATPEGAAPVKAFDQGFDKHVRFLRSAEIGNYPYLFIWLSGNFQLNTPDSYLTTKNTKITKAG